MGTFSPNANLKIAVYADGADREPIFRHYRTGFIRGFTTNPTLMAKAGVTDYEGFAKSILTEVRDLPISFEVFSDEFAEMERQALKIASWGPNVNVKVPIMNTRKESSIPLIGRLLAQKVKLNVTAIFTEEQCLSLAQIAKPGDDVIVSIFAGRIADTGVDPIPLISKAVQIFQKHPGYKILWASPREVLNVYQADECGCHIITVTDDILKKLSLYRKPLDDYSRETVQMFYDDAGKSGFRL